MAQVSLKKSISLGGSNYKWGGGTSFCEEVNSLGGSNYKWGGDTSFSEEVNLFRR